MEGSNGDYREGHSSSSHRRDDYSSSRRRYDDRDDYRSSRHGDRYERYRDKDRERDHERRHREPEDGSHHRSSHRDSGRDYSSRGGGDLSSSSTRHHEEYPSSRDKETRYDSRRGSGRYDGTRYENRGRKRSASPKRRGPTPDLTGVVPIDVRPRRLTMWDLKPIGFENVTAEQAKMSGLFPLPGAPQNSQLSEEALQAIKEGKAPPPVGPAGSSIAPIDVPKLWALNASHSRQARRLVVSKLPPSSTEAEIQNYFNSYIERLNVYKEGSGDAVKDVKKATSGGVAIVEFSDPIYATTALALEDDFEYDGKQLEVRRPADYIVQPPENDANPTLSSGDTVRKDLPDSTEKLVIKGLPTYLTSEQGLELVEAFGAVQGWVLITEADSSESKGVAFLQYKDPAITPVALSNLNGMPLNDEHTISVSYACIGFKQTETAVEAGSAMTMVTSLAGAKSDTPRSRVLLLLNMVTGDDLMDADEYDDILQDVKDECDKFGKVLDMQVPRPLGRSGEGPGVGKVFVRFETEEECAAALQGLAGRKFQERTVVASYYPEDNYDVSAW